MRINTDGMTSARIMYNYLKSKGNEVKILWQTWNYFGVREEDITKIMAEKPDEVYILDIGSDTKVLEVVIPILQKDIPVTIFDNHPPELALIGTKEFKNWEDLITTLKETYPDKFTYHSTHDSCTAAICYDYTTKQGYVNPNNDLWAILGITGDVAKTNTESKPIYEFLRAKYPMLNRGIFYENRYSGFTWDTLDFMAQVFHIPRRIVYDEAPPFCFEAMDEIEQNPKLVGTGWFYIYSATDKLLANIINKREKHPDYTIDTSGLQKESERFSEFDRFTDCPNIYKMLKLNVLWRDQWKGVEDRGNNIVYNFGDFNVSIISHPWNLGSALCSKRAGNSKKTHFAINDIPNKEIHISGRGGKDSVHIGKAFKMCDPKLIDGGGFKEAGSGQGLITDVSEILDALVSGVKRAIVAK